MTAATLSTEELTHLHDVMAGHVETGQMPGLVTLVASGDDVHIDVIGSPSFADPTPLDRSAIFRIASLTKPITAAATMSLVEEGVCCASTRLSRGCCRSSLTAGSCVPSTPSSMTRFPPNGPSRSRNLLSYRFGFGSVMAPPASYPIQRAEAELGLQSIGGPPWPPVSHDVDSWIAALGSLPLMYQPGDHWLYNSSAQVLGVLLARAAGTDIESVLRERVLEPLGLSDTGFTVPADHVSRLTTAYTFDPESG